MTTADNAQQQPVQPLRRGLANFYDADDSIAAGLSDYQTVPVPRGLLRLVTRILTEDDVPQGNAERAAEMLRRIMTQTPPPS
ncbi:hypothetical protein QZH56_37100 (plasmid) [Streptomyces olivoreticuli]|uniref:hypothetical protein n=1 Tax=Streptomyces olivoreticuli TaxID=68246 RepID=UPI0026589868|nr:hypothetical protein [Streptomyces olivoreticuli]WKK27808.1 hypothetical protein QZH56_37100 [Streptomyces olivoreticuli]